MTIYFKYYRMVVIYAKPQKTRFFAIRLIKDFLRRIMKRLSYKHTIAACSLAYVVQSVVNTFVPLLFLTFNSHYGIPLDKISVLILFNFLIQLTIDLASVFFIEKLGYRLSLTLAHAFAATGLVGLTVLPELMDPFVGILISVLFYAIGGGLLEVLVSPTVEACPTKNKEGFMSLLHSFYCWGCAIVIALSTLFFFFFGTEKWKIITLIWAAFPLLNMAYFLCVPIYRLEENEEGGETTGGGLKSLFKSKAFWILFAMMFTAGACELAISQWASTFAEMALGIDKSVGDMAGPFAFAVLMGISRLLYAKMSDKVDLTKVMFYSGVLCIAGYLLASLPSNAILNLCGIGVCGFAVGILWPGTYSLAMKTVKNGGTKMFSLLALAGDVGCASGPAFVGFIATALGNDLKTGILIATAFPIMLIISLIIKRAVIDGRKEKDV